MLFCSISIISHFHNKFFYNSVLFDTLVGNIAGNVLSSLLQLTRQLIWPSFEIIEERRKNTPSPPHTFYWLVWCHDTWSIFLILDWNYIWSICGFCVSLVPGLNFFKVSHVLKKSYLTEIIRTPATANKPMNSESNSTEAEHMACIRWGPMQKPCYCPYKKQFIFASATIPSQVRSLFVSLRVWPLFLSFFFSCKILRRLRENI